LAPAKAALTMRGSQERLGCSQKGTKYHFHIVRTSRVFLSLGKIFLSEALHCMCPSTRNTAGSVRQKETEYKKLNMEKIAANFTIFGKPTHQEDNLMTGPE